jgi:phosphoserine phosphatase
VTHVLVLTADPAARDLDPSTAAAAREALAAAGAEPGQVLELAPRAAAEIPFSGADPGAAEAAARAVLASAAADATALPAAGRRRRLLLADMESTVIEQEMLDELAGLAGIRDRIAAITSRAMNGELDFRAALEARLELLAGMPVSALDELQRRLTYMPGARVLVATMRAHGARCILVSGGFRAFTRRVAAELGFDEEHANDLEAADGRLTGRPLGPVLGKEAKLERLRAAAADLGVGTDAAVAVGDGANDLPMLLEAGLGVAFRAKPAVAAAARVRIDHGDLTALLHLQGYREAEFAAA